MIKSTVSLVLISAAVLMLGGCNKVAESSPNIEAPAAPTLPDKPDTPAAVSVEHNAPAFNPAGSSVTPAAAETSASGAEARAGDVFVKLSQ